ncbi:MAG: SUMF1/EgtB/PvdO family nonheme iron enzyme [Prosthecobacter sp.]
MKLNRRHLNPSIKVAVGSLCLSLGVFHAAEPAKGEAKRADLGGGVTLEVIFIPPGQFMMGSTPEEKKWATGIEGGAQPGTARESFEGEQPRLMRVKNGFWMGRTEVSVGQFRRFVEESGYVTDAEKPGGETQVFDPEWNGYRLTTVVLPHLSGPQHCGEIALVTNPRISP